MGQSRRVRHAHRPTTVPPGAIRPRSRQRRKGHQFFPDIDAHAGELGVVWQDNRGPTYDVQYPIGNTRDAQGRAISAGTDIVNTFVSAWTGSGFGPAVKVSSVGHQSQYEMFSARDLPFHGDYNWISLAELGDGSVVGYMSWTDNRDVVPGVRPARAPGAERLQRRVRRGPVPDRPQSATRRGNLAGPAAGALGCAVHRQQLRQQRRA